MLIERYFIIFMLKPNFQDNQLKIIKNNNMYITNKCTCYSYLIFVYFNIKKCTDSNQ